MPMLKMQTLQLDGRGTGVLFICLSWCGNNVRYSDDYCC
jgi:hypothetical protein